MTKSVSSKENKLRIKYGDTQVAVVPSSLVASAGLQLGWTDARDGIYVEGNLRGELRHVISNRMTLIPRYKAELDPSFKQIIPYVLVINDATGKIFITKRLAGDSRLKGRLSIGIGGHIESAETLHGGMYRELEEEIGITEADVTACDFQGYILDESSEVSSVHLGLVYELHTDKHHICCQEKNVLIGAWGSATDIMEPYETGILESWSEIVFENIVMRGTAICTKE